MIRGFVLRQGLRIFEIRGAFLVNRQNLRVNETFSEELSIIDVLIQKKYQFPETSYKLHNCLQPSMEQKGAIHKNT